MSADALHVLGAGVTGLAAGIASGAPVHEATSHPGGICSSYHRRASDSEAAYRFERGGGHWIFGGDAATLGFIEGLSPCRRYTRDSAVYFAADGRFVPYPLQLHVDQLPADLARRARQEMGAREPAPDATMQGWLRDRFGDALVAAFFGPFHERYTAGLWTTIASQDAYKSPTAPAVQPPASPPVGYNGDFLYPERGLDHLTRRMADRADVRYGSRVVAIDTAARTLGFADGRVERYGRLLSTLPLNRTLELAGLAVAGRPDPFTSVLVINVGAARGPRCPAHHWLYVPDSRAGFHRVGFYTNVSPDFAPAARPDRASLYVEFAWRGGERPARPAVERLCAETVAELQAWQFIGEAEVVDPTWIDVAYTWAWPRSNWRAEALSALEANGVRMVGRYARWQFQGIAESIRDGLAAGRALAAGA
ncbi:MAG: protoporphyrinogen oxidase-like protein [Vicinamibacteria bacterium]|nr:protoporphyrinogen oxidase-like protein [Vicinamibacteria bacterium]